MTDHKEVKIVSIIGLGALGILYGHHLSKIMPQDRLRIIADRDRINRYRNSRIYCNGEECSFNYIAPEERTGPSDLLIFTVKNNHLDEAIEAVKNQVGPQTIIISLLNGITSENRIGQFYGTDNILLSVAQGMDAVKSNNKMSYENMGIICIGDKEPGYLSSNAQALAGFFDQHRIPYEIDENMPRKLWTKFMLNVGVNQAVAVFGKCYGDVQKNGKPREIMIEAMRETIPLAEKEGLDLSEKDIDYWLHVVDSLSPRGKPSMRQDIEAKRVTEVELFSGTVLQLGKKHSLQTPVNKLLYEKINALTQ